MKSVIRKKEKPKNKEDIITSNIFGTMSYLDSQKIAQKLFHLITPKTDTNVEFNTPPKAIFEFWPNIAEEGRVEPDIIIRIHDDCGNEIDIMVEIKWYAVQSQNKDGMPQLFKQWECIDENKQNRTFHLYIVLDKENAKNEIKLISGNQNDFSFRKWNKRFMIMSWRDLIDFFDDEKYKQESPGYSQWINDVVEYYKYLEHQFPPFTGFGFLSTYADLKMANYSVFWNEFFQFDEIGKDILLKNDFIIFFDYH